MANKLMTAKDVVASIKDGMTIGIGGWGPRRKPMALVRELLRSDVKDLTVVAYGGADVGMLCAAGKAMHDGWFKTGDIGVLDAEGFLTIVDRIKDVINRSGEKIAAAEVEACLLQHELLDEAAVFAMPHEVTGEQVVAVVVGKPQSTLTPEDLRAFVAQRLAGYKVPNQIVVRHEPLPRNPAGKMLKASIRKECAHLMS